MNTYNPYVKQYKKAQLETATPEEVLILLYDGAIQFLNKAKIAMERKEHDLAHKNITSCERIILEFMNTLDMDSKGDLARNLYRLYEYLYNTLVNASITKDLAKIDEVLKHLKSLRETWQKAISISNSKKEIPLQESASERSYDTYGKDDDEDEEEDDFNDGYEPSDEYDED